eukprot:CAMPEP_0182499258 /NCGR_PEP_ID=MMETSP1321-20130603/7393_1 /TAXON_ID=91990 /ORGANISM="Bolidomonas sp., Strain RCC1657" /LENGTH=274 /DNA_ID=CAMNT_0024703421 /DNA_START=16 /DNA_END=840 /DNA_ORIENTATION=+
MKFVAALTACLLASANAYTAPLMATKVLKGKKAAKAAPKGPSGGASFSAQAWANAGPSTALPFATAPATLDGSMLGDVGFDPLGFSTTPVGPWFLGSSEPSQGVIGDLEWYREAELIHGRIAQIAVLGFLGPELFGTLPGNSWTGADAYSNTNPLEAFSQVPGLALTQIFLFMSFLEIRRLNIIKEEGRNFQPGDLRIGQGPNRYNPFGLNYSPEEYEEKRLQELKHCRLAMIGVFGLAAQANASGMGVLEQLGGGLAIPNYVSKAGYFFPDGI